MILRKSQKTFAPRHSITSPQHTGPLQQQYCKDPTTGVETFILYLQSFRVDGQVPGYLGKSPVGTVNSKATARAGPWAPRKFPNLMTLRWQDTAYDMRTSNYYIITTVCCSCSHKSHHNITHRHGQNLSRHTHTHTQKVQKSLVRTARHWREMDADRWAATAKHLLRVSYYARASFWYTWHVRVKGLSDDRRIETQNRVYVALSLHSNDTALSWHHNTSWKKKTPGS